MNEDVRRLEIAMIERRTWSDREHRSVCRTDSRLCDPSRRLVWLGYDEESTPRVSFRLDAGGAPVDSAGRRIGLDVARVAVAHPLHLAHELPRWAARFAEERVRQPFPQLAREVHRLTERERRSTALERFAHRMVPAHALSRLLRSGWRLGRPVDGVHDHLYRPVGGDLWVLLHLDDGLDADDPWTGSERVVEAVELSGQPAAPWWSRCGDTAFGVLDPVTASEVVRELTHALD
ncbi:DUF4132 domain-containing protein [Nocardia farcinica]|nr:DUF4132 domain-containing protein [Nocardia farcinica]MBF6266126.1 DUF4132 domain-containing protein [Nocardia farcinica]MCZ9325559.1 DUF4132 domain-containing protein [Nocardia farcinica]SUE28160.1 Uncharacterised protein [Nocardia farcinica]